MDHMKAGRVAVLLAWGCGQPNRLQRLPVAVGACVGSAARRAACRAAPAPVRPPAPLRRPPQQARPRRHRPPARRSGCCARCWSGAASWVRPSPRSRAAQVGWGGGRGRGLLRAWPLRAHVARGGVRGGAGSLRGRGAHRRGRGGRGWVDDRRSSSAWLSCSMPRWRVPPRAGEAPASDSAAIAAWTEQQLALKPPAGDQVRARRVGDTALRRQAGRRSAVAGGRAGAAWPEAERPPWPLSCPHPLFFLPQGTDVLVLAWLCLPLTSSLLSLLAIFVRAGHRRAGAGLAGLFH